MMPTALSLRRNDSWMCHRPVPAKRRGLVDPAWPVSPPAFRPAIAAMVMWKTMSTHALPERAVHVGVQSRILLDHSGALNREHGDFNIPGWHAR